MLHYLHTQTHNKYKDRTQTVLLTKPPNQRTNTCLTFRNMIIFCPKRNIMTFPEPQDTTHADEVCIATRKSKPASVVANIDGTMYVYFHEAPQALNKVLRDVYTSKLFFMAEVSSEALTPERTISLHIHQQQLLANLRHTLQDNQALQSLRSYLL